MEEATSRGDVIDEEFINGMHINIKQEPDPEPDLVNDCSTYYERSHVVRVLKQELGDGHDDVMGTQQRGDEDEDRLHVQFKKEPTEQTESEPFLGDVTKLDTPRKNYQPVTPPTHTQDDDLCKRCEWRSSKWEHYACHTCEKNFCCVVQLTSHAKTHRERQLRKCRSCCKVLLGESSGSVGEPRCGKGTDMCNKCSEEVLGADQHVRDDKTGPPVGYLVRCDMCGENLESQLMLNRHRKIRCQGNKLEVGSKSIEKTTEAFGIKKFDCGVDCNSLKSQLILHNRTHCEKDKQQGVTWRQTKLKTPTKASDRRIEPQHEVRKETQDDFQASDKKFECDVCLRSYRNERTLRQHIRTQHCAPQGKTAVHTDGEISCEYCSKLLSDMLSLAKHIKEHEKSGVYCKTCKKRFLNKQSLAVHTKKQHTVAKPFVCSVCSKSFTQNYSLKEHMVTHSDAKLLKCDICGENFRHRRTLQRHKLKHSYGGVSLSNRLACAFCQKEFEKSLPLISHVRECHREQCAHSCLYEYCGAVFTERSTLKIHYRVHTGDKPYKCDHCGKYFSRAHHLKIHQRLHTGERPYKCVECPKSFVRLDHLKLHKKSHDNKTARGCSGKVYELRYRCKDEGCDEIFAHRIQLHRHIQKIHTPFPKS